jgi:hypothetical protein
LWEIRRFLQVFIELTKTKKDTKQLKIVSFFYIRKKI